MIKQNNKSIETKLLPHKTGKTSLFLGGVIVLIIAITPYIFYSYKSFPKDVQHWEVSFFTIKTEFASVNTYMWFLLGKIVPLLLLLIWFFTCKHWWHWIILVPIAMYAFQLWGIINESEGLDEIEMIYLVPLMAILIPFVYLIRAKLFNNLRGSKEFEADLAKEKSIWQQVTDLFR
jgi:hypothetical protein